MCEVLYGTAFKILVTKGFACVVSFGVYYADFSRLPVKFQVQVYFREIVSDVANFLCFFCCFCCFFFPVF